jgi:hypothetical protein
VSKTLSKIQFKGGEIALLEKDEQGRVCHYALDGVWMVDAEESWEIIEEIGTFNTEFEFRMLVARMPAVYLRDCGDCGGPVLVIVEDGGGLCRVCGMFVNDEEENKCSKLLF